MAAKYKDEAERWKRRLDESESMNARLRHELTAIQQMYSPAIALTSLSHHLHHPITPPNSLDTAGQTVD